MFKKLLYFSAALVLTAACDEDFDDWASPQSNEQEEIQTVAATSNIDALTFDLNEVEDDSLLVVDMAYDMPEGYEFSEFVGKIIVSVTDDSGDVVASDEYSVPVSASGKVAKADLQSIITSHFGKRPAAREAVLNVYAKLFTSGDHSTVVNTNSVDIALTVTPEATPIASAYYLVGDMLAWSADGMQQFSHSDIDVYDDPVFTIVFTTTAENQYWKIIPQTNIDDDNFWANPGVIGVVNDGDTSKEGMLVNQDANAGKIEAPGKYRMTINMLDFTYKIEEIKFENFVYFIGATDGWANAEQKLALQNENGLYTGYIYMADPNGWGNQFKFQRVAGSWDNEINSGTFTGGISGDLEDAGGNIGATAGEGVYYVELDLGAATLKGTRVTLMGIIGDFNGWGGDVEMTWNSTDYCFEASQVGATAAGWKFRVNSDWGLNLGGELTNLWQDGSNLFVDGNIVKLYPTRKDNDNIYCTVE